MILKGLLKGLLKGCRKSVELFLHKSVASPSNCSFTSLSQVRRNVCRKSVASLLKGCCNDVERSVETFVEFFFHKSVETFVTSLSQVC